MSINARCPKCGSYRVQLSDERSKHGCFWFLICDIIYRKTAVKLPPFKVEDVRLKNECLNCYKSL